MAEHLTSGDDNHKVPENIDRALYGSNQGPVYGWGIIEPDDAVYAGAGHDTVVGSSRDDFIKGEEGDDYIDGQNGWNVISGGIGNDTIFLGERGWGYGEDGNDMIFGGDQKDYISGGAGNDVVMGFGGYDEIYGGEGNDALVGGDGGDDLYGEEGSDYILGGSGDDLLCGGADNDRLVGGEGADIFLFVPGENGGVDIIEDFEVGVDKLRFLDNQEEKLGIYVLIEPVVHDGKFSSRITFPYVEGASNEAIIVVGVTPEQMALEENFRDFSELTVWVSNPYDVTEVETTGINSSDYSMLRKPEMEYSDEELGEAGGDADAAWVEVPSMDWSDRESELASQEQLPVSASVTQSDASFADAEEPIGWSWTPPAPSISPPVSMEIFYPHVDDFAF